MCDVNGGIILAANLYEAMFLVVRNKAKADHAKVLEEITEEGFSRESYDYYDYQIRANRLGEYTKLWIFAAGRWVMSKRT